MHLALLSSFRNSLRKTRALQVLLSLRTPDAYLVGKRTYHAQEYHLLFSLPLGSLALTEASPHLKTSRWSPDENMMKKENRAHSVSLTSSAHSKWRNSSSGRLVHVCVRGWSGFPSVIRGNIFKERMHHRSGLPRCPLPHDPAVDTDVDSGPNVPLLNKGF